MFLSLECSAFELGCWGTVWGEGGKGGVHELRVLSFWAWVHRKSLGGGGVDESTVLTFWAWLFRKQSGGRWGGVVSFLAWLLWFWAMLWDWAWLLRRKWRWGGIKHGKLLQWLRLWGIGQFGIRRRRWSYRAGKFRRVCRSQQRRQYGQKRQHGRKRHRGQKEAWGRVTGSKLDDSKGIGGTKTLKKLMTYVKTVFSFFFFSSLMSDYRRWGVEMVNMIQII